MRATDDPEVLGLEIRQARKALRWTQAELAERAQVSERTIRNLEAGKGAAQPGTLGLVLDALGHQPELPEFPDDVAFIVNAIGLRLLALSPTRRAALGGRLMAVMMEDASTNTATSPEAV